jgi:hypothetical protein
MDHANVQRMNDPRNIHESAIMRVLNSDIPEDKKRAVIAALIQEAKQAEPRLDALRLDLLTALKVGADLEEVRHLAEQLVTETEEYLRRNG